MSEATAEIAERYAEDGFKLPKTWQGRMEAIVHGAIDWGDVEPLITECATVADKAVIATQEERQRQATAQGGMDLTPLWSEFVDWFTIEVADLQDPNAEGPQSLIRMGQVADLVEAGE